MNDMDRERMTERQITAWMHDEAPNQVPDRVLDATFERTRTTAQVSTLPGWRFLEMRSKTLRITAGAAAIVLIVVVGVAILSRGGAAAIGGSAPSPSPSAVACAKAMTVHAPLDEPGCRYASSVFGPAVSVIGDARWRDIEESARSLTLDLNQAAPERATGIGLVAIDRLVAKPCQPDGALTDGTTTPFTASSPGSGPADLFAWITKNTPLELPTPKPTTVAGHPGLETTIEVGSATLAACGGTVWITRPGDDTGVDGGQWAAAFEGFTWRIAAIDVNGTTVLVQTWAPPDTFATFRPEADKLLATARFE